MHGPRGYYSVFSLFFALGQTLPTVRGDGIYQPSMEYALHYMRDHKRWIHVFPESKVNQTGEMIRWKWGIGRLIMDGGSEIVVVPVWHKGMEDIMPEGVRFRPRPFQRLTVIFGDPIDFTDLLQDYQKGQAGEVETRIKITQRCKEAIEALSIREAER
ncbi:hypothetical protein BC937DRAFT_95442, partial [Endogone sp. FLAS-F59071]